MKTPLSPPLFESIHTVKWVPPIPPPVWDARGSLWHIANRIQWREGILLIGEKESTWVQEGAQLGMDFSNLLLVVKGEWSHTEMDEICLCLKQGWLEEDETEKASRPLSCQYHLGA